MIMVMIQRAERVPPHIPCTHGDTNSKTNKYTCDYDEATLSPLLYFAASVEINNAAKAAKCSIFAMFV